MYQEGKQARSICHINIHYNVRLFSF